MSVFSSLISFSMSVICLVKLSLRPSMASDCIFSTSSSGTKSSSSGPPPPPWRPSPIADYNQCSMTILTLIYTKLNPCSNYQINYAENFRKILVIHISELWLNASWRESIPSLSLSPWSSIFASRTFSLESASCMIFCRSALMLDFISASVASTFCISSLFWANLCMIKLRLRRLMMMMMMMMMILTFLSVSRSPPPEASWHCPLHHQHTASVSQSPRWDRFWDLSHSGPCSSQTQSSSSPSPPASQQSSPSSWHPWQQHLIWRWLIHVLFLPFLKTSLDISLHCGDLHDYLLFLSTSNCCLFPSFGLLNNMFIKISRVFSTCSLWLFSLFLSLSAKSPTNSVILEFTWIRK